MTSINSRSGVSGMEPNQRLPSQLGPRDVHVWYRWTHALAPDEIERAEATLSADEHARRRRFSSAHDQRDYTIAHDLLRRSLSRYAEASPSDWTFDVGLNGKPYIRNAPRDSELPAHPLSFSLSHTRGLVACAVASGVSIGVDVESVDRVGDPTAISDTALSPGEIDRLGACPEHLRALRVLELWTLKEAFVKASGEGLAQSLRTISFDLARPGAIELDLPAGFDRKAWQFAQFAPSPQTLLAVAVRSAIPATLQFVARSSQQPDGMDLVIVRRTI